MRDRYLFKAKRKDNGNWVEGFYFYMVSEDGKHVHHFIIPLGIDLSLRTPIGEIQVEVYPSTVCQYMELENRIVLENGIYQYTDTTYGKCTGVIKYGEYTQDGSGGEYGPTQHYGFYIKVIKVEPYDWSDLTQEEAEEFYPAYLREMSVAQMFERGEDIQMLGNIFDTPELLEGDSK